ncbi:hypothetical protein A2U01_0067786, partial [Trifolium medium]|nr:hypothetical protein [Trifolium medium]
HKKGAVTDFKVYVRGVLVDYSNRELNRFLGTSTPRNCAFAAVKDDVEGWPFEDRNQVKEFLGRLGTEWHKYSGGERPTKIRLSDFIPVARAW